MEAGKRSRGGGRAALEDRKTKGRYHHGSLREALVEASLALIAEQDVSAVSLREVARRAGVSPAAPYHHFREKNALLAAVAEEGFRRLATAAERARVPSAPAAALEQVLMVYITFATQHPAHFQVMFLPELHAGAYAELDRAAEGTFAVLVRAVQQAIPRAPRRHSPEQMAAVTFATAHGLASLARKESLWMKASAKGLPGVVRAAAETLARAWAG